MEVEECVGNNILKNKKKNGAGWGTRTPDLMITSQLLYQLS